MADLNTANTMGREAFAQGCEAAKEYSSRSADMIGEASANLGEFVRSEPWVALIAAFAVGYFAAHLIRRVGA